MSIAPIAGIAAGDGSPDHAAPIHVDAEAGTAPFQLVKGSASGEASIPYSHYDCVGPGPSPALDDEHDTHTDHVSGFVFGAGSMQFLITAIDPFSSGMCPVEAVDGPYMGHGFTGHYALTALCSEGTTNAGDVALHWEGDFLYGLLLDDYSFGSGCTGWPGDPFALEIQYRISETDEPFGWEKPPMGGIELSVDQ